MTRGDFGLDEGLEQLRDTGAGPGTQAALLGYVRRHRPTGDFLRALLSNDLRETFARADEVNVLAVGALVRWVYNYAPGPCWGSPERVAAWLDVPDTRSAR